MPKLSSELFRFLMAGISAVATDWLSYLMLLNFINPALAKAISFALGSIVAYVVNKLWTFKRPDPSAAEVFQFTALYMSTWVVNVSVNQILLGGLPGVFPLTFTFAGFSRDELIVRFALLCATGTSTVLNYLGMKFWVFKRFGYSDNDNKAI